MSQRASPALIRYRVVDRGWPHSLDQRLTVFEDRAVEPDERHRSGDPAWFELEDAELRQILFTISRTSARSRSRGPELMMVSAHAALVDAFNWNPFETPHWLFEIRRGRRKIVGDFHALVYGVAPLMKLLDALRVRAIRLHPR